MMLTHQSAAAQICCPNHKHGVRTGPAQHTHRGEYKEVLEKTPTTQLSLDGV